MPKQSSLKRFRSDEKDWVVISRDQDNYEPEYETLNIAEVVDELQGLDELSVLGSETTMTQNERVINDDTIRNIKTTNVCTIQENKKQCNEINENSSITQTSTITRSDSGENPLCISLSSLSASVVTKTNLLPSIPSIHQQQQQQFWSLEEKLAAETVANLVAPGSFINGSDCAIFSMFDKAIKTHHTIAKPIQDKDKDKITQTTLLNLQDSSKSIVNNKGKDEIYDKIKQAVESRLTIE